MKDARSEWLSKRGAILAIGVVFAAFLFATLDRSPGSDEMWFYYQVKRLIETGTPWISPDGTLTFLHPPLYPLLLSIPIKILGMHRWTACIVGVLCATGILAASERMTRRMQRLSAAIVLAAIAWNPAFIQAALLLDIDNTLIAASCFLLLLLALNWYDRPPKRLEIAGGILLAAVAFGSKWTTPLILPAMAVLFLALKRNGRRAGATLAIAIAAGFSLFLILFLLYCSMKGLNPAEPLRYIVGAGKGKSGLSLGFKARILLETAVWFQPPLLAAFAGAWILRAKRWFRERRFDGREILGAFAVAVLGGYALVGGTTFGFPRYFIPAIAPMVLFTATSLRDEDWPDFGRPPALFALLFAVILLEALVVGDPILTWRFELREALAFGETGAFRGVLSKFALQAAIGCLLPIALWTWFLRPKTLGQAVAALLLAAVTQGAGLAAAQGLADYNLTYNYGERGIPGVVDKIARRYSPGERVLATLDITGSLQLRDVEAPALPGTVWASVENFTRELEDPASTYVAYSVSGNTVNQLRKVLLSAPIQNRLRRDFTPQDFGGYRLWIRR